MRFRGDSGSGHMNTLILFDLHAHLEQFTSLNDGFLANSVGPCQPIMPTAKQLYTCGQMSCALPVATAC